jgi:hypothetical protein
MLKKTLQQIAVIDESDRTLNTEEEEYMRQQYYEALRKAGGQSGSQPGDFRTPE